MDGLRAFTEKNGMAMADREKLLAANQLLELAYAEITDCCGEADGELIDIAIDAIPWPGG